MKVVKCDRCEAVETIEVALTGTVPDGAMERLMYRYLNKFDLCRPCAKELRGIVADWWEEDSGKVEPLQELDTFGNKGE